MSHENIRKWKADFSEYCDGLDPEDVLNLLEDRDEARALLREARAERDRANADAARYRWLKANARRIDFAGLCVSDMGQLDARIDAHLRGEEGRTPETQPLPAEEMCPNCVTPWKCNGPHRPLRGEGGRS